MAEIPHYRHDSLFEIPIEVTCDVNVAGDLLDIAVVAADTDPASTDWSAATNDALVVVGTGENGANIYRVITRLLVGPGSHSGQGNVDVLLPEGKLLDVIVRIHHAPQLVTIDAGRIYAD